MTKQSIPRLELLSALTLARLITAVKNALQPVAVIHSVYCWLDSLTAIYWIVQEQNKVAATRVGDVVTVSHDAEVLPRSQWVLGKTVKLVEGRDGVVRGAEVRVNSKGGRRTTVSRPLQKLFPMEVRHADGAVKATGDAELDAQPPRPGRAAALTGEQRRRGLNQCYLDGD